jgi:hypothetical protein
MFIPPAGRPAASILECPLLTNVAPANPPQNERWNKAQAQLFHTAHVDYHPIFEIMHFDINWHIPHHVSVRIPWCVCSHGNSPRVSSCATDVAYLSDWQRTL